VIAQFLPREKRKKSSFNHRAGKIAMAETA